MWQDSSLLRVSVDGDDVDSSKSCERGNTLMRIKYMPCCRCTLGSSPHLDGQMALPLTHGLVALPPTPSQDSPFCLPVIPHPRL
jgi:hypothetical protein